MEFFGWHAEPAEIAFLLIVGIASIRADILLAHIAKVLDGMVGAKVKGVAKVKRAHRGWMAHPMDEKEWTSKK